MIEQFLGQAVIKRLGAKRQLGLRDLTVGSTTSLGPIVISSSLPSPARVEAECVVRVAVCSRVVNVGSRRVIRRRIIAVRSAVRRRRVGGG